jgi:hypothetical protein
METNKETQQETGQLQVDTLPETLVNIVSIANSRPQRVRRVSESHLLKELLAMEPPPPPNQFMECSRNGGIH